MMKTVKTILITLFVMLSFASCTKDEDGQWIQYYKNKTGVGYVFYKWDNDSIAPIPNLEMKIESHTRGSELFPGNSHCDYVFTDENGKYEFKVLKKIDRKEVQQCFVGTSNNPNNFNIILLISGITDTSSYPLWAGIGNDPYLSINDVKNSSSNIFLLDTMFFTTLK